MVLVALSAPYKLAVALIMVGTALNGLTGSYGTYLTVRVCGCVYLCISIKAHHK